MEKPVLVVRVLLQNEEGKFLFLQRAKNKRWASLWTLPGGKVEFGEVIENACKREVREETKLEIFDLKLLDYEEYLPEDTGNKHYVAIYFKAKWSGKIEINEESERYEWVSLEEFEKLDVLPKQRKFFRQLLSKAVRK